MNDKQMEMMAREHDIVPAMDAEVAEEVVQAVSEGTVTGYRKIENAVVGGYKKVEEKFSEKFLNENGTMKTGKIGEAVMDGFQKIEEGVVGNYKKLETGIVEGFEKVTDKCVEKLFAKDGESVEDAKKRLSGDK